jgi:beta-galactosidase
VTDGHIQGQQVISKSFSGKGIDRMFAAVADTTRMVLRVSAEFDRIRPIAKDFIAFELSGPAVILSEIPFSLVGGPGAIWIGALEDPGLGILRATHPRPNTQQVAI